MDTLDASQNQVRFDILQFGDLVKRQLSIATFEQISPGSPPVLNQQEITFISQYLQGDSVDIAAAYRQRLEFGREFYIGVRQHLKTLMEVWDSVVEAKDAFDKLESLAWNRQFMEAFLLSTDTIPARVNIGSCVPVNTQLISPKLLPLPSMESDLLLGPSAWNDEWQVSGERRQANGIDLLPHHTAEDLTLSVSSLSDIATEDDDDEDEDEDEDEDDETYEDDDDEGYREYDNKYAEDTIHPMAPGFQPMEQDTRHPQWPLIDNISEDWEQDLHLLIRDIRNTSENGLFGLDDQQLPGPLEIGYIDDLDGLEADAGEQAISQEHQSPESGILITPHKRKVESFLDQSSGRETEASAFQAAENLREPVEFCQFSWVYVRAEGVWTASVACVSVYLCQIVF